MSAINGNDVYLAWDSVDISAFWTGDADLSATNNVQEITAGSGVDHVQRAPGLNDHSIAFPVIYDDTDLADYIAKLQIGKKATLTYGPEGSTVGKPKFECSMILDSISGPKPTIDKQMVQFDLSFSAADEPTATIDADTF